MHDSSHVEHVTASRGFPAYEPHRNQQTFSWKRQHKGFLLDRILLLKVTDLSILWFGLVFQREGRLESGKMLNRVHHLVLVLRFEWLRFFVKCIVLVCLCAVLELDNRIFQSCHGKRIFTISTVLNFEVKLCTTQQTCHTFPLTTMWLKTRSLSSLKLKLTHRDVVLLQRRNLHFGLWLKLAVFKVANFAKNFPSSQFGLAWLDVLLWQLLLTVVESFPICIWRERRGRGITAHTAVDTCNALWNVPLVFIEVFSFCSASNCRLFLSPNFFEGTFHWSVITAFTVVVIIAV